MVDWKSVVWFVYRSDRGTFRAKGRELSFGETAPGETLVCRVRGCSRKAALAAMQGSTGQYLAADGSKKNIPGFLT